MGKVQSDIIKIVSKNYGWVIGMLSVICVITFNVIKFMEFITYSTLFNYYGLDINLYQYNNENFVYDSCLGIVFMFALISLLYSYKQISDNFKKKKILKGNITNYLLLLISNIFIIILIKPNFTVIQFVIYTIILIAIESISAWFAFKDYPEKENNNDIINTLKLLPIFIIIILIMHIGVITINIKNNKEYRMIDNNTVIIYTNKDYYLTLNCEVIKDKIKIYKGTQKKIDNNNIYSEVKKYKDAELIYK